MPADVDYFYIHEKPRLKYVVAAKPLPADSSTAEFHKLSPDGDVFLVKNDLKREGEGTFPFDFTANGVKVQDSPLFVEFTFKKGQLERKNVVVISVAEPAVRAIFAPPEAYPGEKIKMEVIAWDARAFDQPNMPTQFEERNTGRITKEVRDQTKWQLEGADLAERGESITSDCIKKEHLGKLVTAEAFLGDKPPRDSAGVVAPRESNRFTRARLRRSAVTGAVAQIAVPRLAIEGPKTVNVGAEIVLRAKIEPEIEGTYAWSTKMEDKVGLLEAKGVTDSILGKVKSKEQDDVTVECAFTSKATKRAYRAEHKLTVGEDSYTTALEAPPDEPYALESTVAPPDFYEIANAAESAPEPYELASPVEIMEPYELASDSRPPEEPYELKSATTVPEMAQLELKAEPPQPLILDVTVEPAPTRPADA